MQLKNKDSVVNDGTLPPWLTASFSMETTAMLSEWKHTWERLHLLSQGGSCHDYRYEFHDRNVHARTMIPAMGNGTSGREAGLPHNQMILMHHCRYEPMGAVTAGKTSDHSIAVGSCPTRANPL